MKMDGWQDRLHFSFLGEHFLFGRFRLDSLPSFLLASLITLCICFSERMLTLALSKHWHPFAFTRRSRLRIACWRTFLFWVVTLERLLYMLIAMTFHLGILLVVITSLSAGQLIIEYVDASNRVARSSSTRSSHIRRSSTEADRIKEPLLNSADTEDIHDEENSSSIPLSVTAHPLSPPDPHPVSRHAHNGTAPPPAPSTRPRSKSKPDEIFIHPTQSNLMRAEILAVGLGVKTGNSELVDTSYIYSNAPSSTQSLVQHAWGADHGRDVARGLLLSGNSEAKG